MKRYDWANTDGMREEATGEWVRYEDLPRNLRRCPHDKLWLIDDEKCQCDCSCGAPSGWRHLRSCPVNGRVDTQ